ncbi:MAG: DUF3626 domain-containing protein [Desulfovibrionaceae bacterium]|nr:DUF3626 domain-containing protein [Desulfovibrionaceae bacterium]
MPHNIQADPIVQRQLAERGITEKTGVFGEHKVQIGTGSPINLSSIKRNSLPFQGFTSATKVARGQAGLAASAHSTVHVLISPGVLQADKLLSALKTNAEYMSRLGALGQLSEAQKQNSLWAFAPAVESLSSTELAFVYQSFTSAEMDLLQSALRHEGRNNIEAKDARAAEAQLFDLQALVLKEMSNRVSNGRLDDLIAQEPNKSAEYNALRPSSLSQQYAGQDSTRAVHTHDISAANLHTLANVAAQSATQREKNAAAHMQKLSTRGISATPKEMGDILRQSPLTINIPTRRLLRDTAFILNPNEPMPNIFHMQAQGIVAKSEDYMLQRNETEKLVFPELEGHGAIPDERPVYGALNTQRSQTGAADRSYGTCSIVLKPEVARRATFIAEDTFFSPMLSITAQRRANFYALLDGSGLPAALTTALRNLQSPERAMMDAWFDERAQAEGLTALVLKNPPNELISADKEECFAALCLQAFGDTAATRAKVASYDNLESLLFGLDDLNGSLLAQAAEKRAAGLDPSVRLAMNYIEAQVHGALIPSRDFQEIRVDVDEAEPEQRAQLINRMEQFSKATGVKVVYIASKPEEITLEGTGNTVEKFSSTDSNRIQNTFTNGVQYYAQHIRAEANTALGEALEHIQDHLRSIVQASGLSQNFTGGEYILRGAILDRMKSDIGNAFGAYFARPSESQPTAKDIVDSVIKKVAEPLLTKKAELLSTVETLPLSTAQKAVFSSWVRSSRVSTVAELQLIVDNATTLATALNTLAQAEPPLSPQETFTLLARAAGTTDVRIASYAHGLPPDKEYGADDKLTDLWRSSSLAYSLLRAGEPPMDDAHMEALHTRLTSADMRTLLGQFMQIANDDAIINSADCSADYGKMTIIARMSNFLLQNAASQVNQPASTPEFSAELSLVPEKNRALLRSLFPEAMAQFDSAHPAYAPFPTAAQPMHMPASDDARRGFLVRHLDTYLAHEQTFDKGRSTHGRGHITRAFIFASAMCSILEEQGVPIDRNAVLCAITGHDAGRQNSGTDFWEKESAAIVVQNMRSDFGTETMGAAYEQAVLDSITKQSRSAEAMVFKSADSLDIGRTAPFDLSRMPFLRGSNGESISSKAITLREQLAQEADFLQRLSNPLCMSKNIFEELGEEMNRNHAVPLVLENLRQQSYGLSEDIAQAFEAEQQLTAEQLVAKFENIVRDNQQLFPVLSKYYH